MITQQFAREYINKPSFRTPANKARIREAILKLTGQRLNAGCSTCYIEALFKILNKKQMASNNYILKKGALLTVFGNASRTYSWKTITDEIAEQILREYPEKRIFFDKIPAPVVAVPEPVVELPKSKPVNEMTHDVVELPKSRPVNEMTHEIVEKVKAEKKTSKKTK